MAAIVLTLDTTPPLITWGAVERNATTVRVPFSLDEPGMLGATALVDGVAADTVASGTDVVVEVPPMWQDLELSVHVRDDVLNTATRGLRVSRGVARLAAAIAGRVANRAGTIARGRAGRVMRPRPGDATA